MRTNLNQSIRIQLYRVGWFCSGQKNNMVIGNSNQTFYDQYRSHNHSTLQASRFLSALSFYYFTIHCATLTIHKRRVLCVFEQQKKRTTKHDHNKVIHWSAVIIVQWTYSDKSLWAKIQKKWNLEAFEFNWSGPKVEDWRITF